MPGLVGLIGDLPREQGILRVKQMLDSLSSESFYSRGFYVNEEIGLYIGWSVHAGSFSDRMPIQMGKEGTSLFLAGEVFTSPDQLRVLKAPEWEGVEASDARHLVSLYMELGESFFESLNGTFCGVIADVRAKRLMLFNDRLGHEKLFYSHEPEMGAFLFSSEAKSLLNVLPDTRKFDRQGLAQFLTYGCPLGEKTLYRGIATLPAASVWEFHPKQGLLSKRTYFRPESWSVDSSLNTESFQEKFNETFERVLPKYFSGAIPPALSLTGGWDTRMILAAGKVPPQTLPCYTFAGLSGETVDVRQAQKVAQRAGQSHAVLRLQPNFLERFWEHAEKTIYVSDGYADIGLTHEIYLNRLARDISSVRLTGNFGSEVLRGMTTFKRIPLKFNWFERELQAERDQIGDLESAVSAGADPHFAIFKEIPWKHSTTVRLASSQLQVRTPYLDNDILKLACACPPHASRRSLAASCVRRFRPDLLEIPTDRGESGNSSLFTGLRSAWYKATFKLDYWLCEGTPDSLSGVVDSAGLRRILPIRHKYLDYRRWLKNLVKTYPVEGLPDSITHELLGAESVARLLHGQDAGKGNLLPDLTALLTLGLIEKSLLQPRLMKPSVSDLNGQLAARTDSSGGTVTCLHP